MSASEKPARPLNILAVDDAPTNRQILTIFLGKLGHAVHTADDGFQAVEKFAALKPDLVLMDVMMPGMDGYEATRKIKQLSGDRWVPVIFLSALDKDENLVAGLDAGGDDYLTKPINFVVLDAKIRSVARTLEMQRNLDRATKQMASISNNISDGVVTIDTGGIIRWASFSAHNIFGYDDGELIGQPVSVLMAEPMASEHQGYVKRYLAGGEPKVIGVSHREVQGLRKNGRPFPVEISVTEMVVEGERSFVGVLRDITERKLMESRMRSNAERLQRYYDEQEREHALAQEILSRVIAHPELVAAGVEYWVSPATNFSGDVLAAMRRSDGKTFAILADATGHGLAAAISALPIMTMFYGQVSGGRDAAFMVTRMNAQLRTMLPAGRFVAATILVLDEPSHTAEIWQAGMPDLLHLGSRGELKARIRSAHLPLGVVDIDDAAIPREMLRVEWTPGDQFVLFSDGLIEATDREGRVISTEQVIQLLAAAPRDRRLAAVRNAIHEHLKFSDHPDDISVMMVDCP